MTVFEFGGDIHPKDRASARFLGKLHRKLVEAYMQQKARCGVRQRDIAERTGMDKATISRILSGGGNPTARTIAEISWALDLEPDISFISHDRDGANLKPGPLDAGNQQLTDRERPVFTGGWRRTEAENLRTGS